MGAELPFQLGPYRVEAEIGAGGFGRVYRATLEGDLGFRRGVALKVLHAELVGEDDAVVRMLADEARLMARMRHPRLAAVDWFGRLPGPDGAPVFVLAMEYVAGEGLRPILRESPGGLEPRRVARIGRDLAQALAHAHALPGEDGRPLGLVHRDLKPENVIVEPDGGARLLDFGVALARERLAERTATNLVRGTLNYLSPEQVRGARDLDGRTDLWSLGALLWECLTGRRLVEGSSPAEVTARIVRIDGDEAAAMLPATAGPLRGVIASLLTQERSARTPMAEAVVRALDGAMGRLP